jgi:hypothetical protein
MSPLTFQQKQDFVVAWRASGMTQSEFAATHTTISARTLRAWVKETRRPDDGVAAAHAVITKAIVDLTAILGAIEAAAPCHPDAPMTAVAERQAEDPAPGACVPVEPASPAAAESIPATAPSAAVTGEAASQPTTGTPLRRARRGSFYEAVAAMESAGAAEAGDTQRPLPQPSTSADGLPVPASAPAPPGRLAVPRAWHFYL